MLLAAKFLLRFRPVCFISFDSFVAIVVSCLDVGGTTEVLVFAAPSGFTHRPASRSIGQPCFAIVRFACSPTHAAAIVLFWFGPSLPCHPLIATTIVAQHWRCAYTSDLLLRAAPRRLGRGPCRRYSFSAIIGVATFAMTLAAELLLRRRPPGLPIGKTGIAVECESGRCGTSSVLVVATPCCLAQVPGCRVRGEFAIERIAPHTCLRAAPLFLTQRPASFPIALAGLAIVRERRGSGPEHGCRFRATQRMLFTAIR
mmetsp:Transcript_246/g.551  ORF Transcript_246/g.551 Transcript_246/m.551 type:complete len:257 (+) Transcript_246:2895-3665(+)